MAKGRDKRGREDKRKKKKPKSERTVPIPAVTFQHHSVASPPAEKSEG